MIAGVTRRQVTKRSGSRDARLGPERRQEERYRRWVTTTRVGRATNWFNNGWYGGGWRWKVYAVLLLLVALALLVA